MKYVLDASRMETRREAHAYLKEQLSFPDYYGYNLDALFDCLGELTDTTVEFVNLPEEETYFNKVLWVFRDAARGNTGLTVEE